MKKIIISSLAALSLILCALTFAAAATTAPIVKTPTKSAEKKPIISTINVYESPSATSKIIKKLPANEDLVAIFHQGEWVKVGDRADGTTGWLNLPQYHQAKKDFYHEYFHAAVDSVYVNTRRDKDGKRVIEAYRNGKKLSDEDAKKLFAKMQVQEERQWKAMQNDYLNAQRALDDAFHSPMMYMPGIVVIQNPDFPSAQQSAATPVQKSTKNNATAK